MSSFNTVFAVLAGSRSDAAVLDAAAALAGKEGRVSALAVRSDPVRVLPMVGEAGAAAAAELMSVLEEQAKARAARARSGFEAWRAKAGAVRAEFQEAKGHPSETAAALARNADVVAVARPREEDEPMAAALVEACLFGSGRPVLMVPPNPPKKIGARVGVLWDGSRTAARALGDAMPLLADAQSVTVFTAGGVDEEVPSADAVARRLQAGGVKAAAKTVAASGEEGQALVAAAAEAGCDLLVMGGYGHSRLREMILGGVTRHML
ncbi:MAG TPA: universal stress protein, partial [Alphaproteobacteria bacterium]|nr:universal stress protein [Alphaproteobacteria bacterium]